MLEYVIDFVEMLISCYFATRFYEKKISEKGRALLLFALIGAACMFSREMGVIPIPDFAVPIAVLFLYSWRTCQERAISAAFLSVLNYFLLGVINILVPLLLLISLRLNIRSGVLEHENRAILLVSIHLVQVIVFGLILKFQKHFLEILRTSSK